MSLLNSLPEQLIALREQAQYPKPICRLLVDGSDITSAIEQRLISIELTDNRGMEADQLTISLSDHDGLLAIPPHGAQVLLWLGWSNTGLTFKGSYTVDETEHSGAPDVLSIRARAADLRGALKTKRERSWSNTTLGAVLKQIASSHNLKPVISAKLASIALVQLDQSNESDANLLTRLGQEHDAIASIKAGHLLFSQAGNSTSASGLPLPHIHLTRSDGDGHSFLQADRDSYSGVKAYYYEINSAEKKEAIAGGGDNLKELRHSYTDQASALRAARSEWQRLQRGSATLNYTLAHGRPDLIPELTYSLHDIKDEISAIIWLGGNISHSFTPDSYTTRLELESKLPDSDEIDQLAEQNTHYTGVQAYYRDEKTGEQRSVSQGDLSNAKRLTHLYANKANAERAVKREYSRLQKTEA